MVSQAEQLLGVNLPAEYITLLRIQNGGYTREEFEYPVPEWEGDAVQMESLAGIVPGNWASPLNILQSKDLSEEWHLPPHQILLAGDGHTWITLDYRNSDVPPVAYIDAECGGETQVAQSFAEFLDGLRPAPPDDEL
jgi:hypothetical protein